MKDLLRTVIPPEVIDSWLRGEYLVGTRRGTGYDFIGWSLMLRGFYRYDVRSLTRPIDTDSSIPDRRDASPSREALTHWGYCIVDLSEGDLFFGGLRLHTAPDAATAKTLQPPPSLWVSVFSKFQESSDAPDLYFVHKTYKTSESSRAKQAADRLRTTILSKHYAAVEYGTSAYGPQKISELEEGELQELLGFLQRDFRSEIEEIEAETQDGFRGLVRLDLSRREQTTSEPLTDMTIPGEYGAVGGVGLTGLVRFHRLNRRE